MSKGLVLISGVNGYIAAVAAKHFLDNGYSVRGTVRKLSSAQSLLTESLKAYADAGKFTVVEVPDITVDGAFDEAVKNVTAITHMAAPISFLFTDPAPVLHAATVGTTTVLNSALKAGPQLQSVTLTSSIAAIANGHAAPYTYTEKDWNDVAESEVQNLGTKTPGPVIYSASKTAAERAFWKWKEENKPGFVMNAVNPVFVIGPPVGIPKSQAEVPKTTWPIWTVFKGDELPTPFPGLPYVVDVRDVARLHLRLVEGPEGTDGERYIASGEAGHPQAYADILREAFPEARGRIQEGRPGEGYVREGGKYGVDKEVDAVVDSGKAGGLIGGWTGLEKSVVESVRAFEGLV